MRYMVIRQAMVALVVLMLSAVAIANASAAKRIQLGHEQDRSSIRMEKACRERM
jgi:hypothetical protein